MKEKRTPRLLSLALAVCLSMGLALPASAAETTDGQDAGSSPFTFQFRNGEATITGYAVEPSDRVSHLEIPATATDESGQVYPVTAIDSKVFRNCTWINSVTIPDSVTSVGSDAFNGSGLTSVTVPATVEDWGGLVFANCDSLRSVTVEEGVTEIPSYMFGNCASLTSVQLPSTLTELGDQCFQNTGLTSVNLPSGLQRHGPDRHHHPGHRDRDRQLCLCLYPDALHHHPRQRDQAWRQCVPGLRPDLHRHPGFCDQSWGADLL